MLPINWMANGIRWKGWTRRTIHLQGRLMSAFEEGSCYIRVRSGQVSHGEMVRAVNDERMILDPDNLMFLYQGLSDADNRGDYGRLPYKLGLLRAVKD